MFSVYVCLKELFFIHCLLCYLVKGINSQLNFVCSWDLFQGPCPCRLQNDRCGFWNAKNKSQWDLKYNHVIIEVRILKVARAGMYSINGSIHCITEASLLSPLSNMEK